MRNLARTVIGAALAAVLGLQAPGVRAETPVPDRDGAVTDLTGILREQTVDTLNRILSGFERATGNQVAVLMVPSTQPEALDDFGVRVLRAWELGGAEGRGVLLLWSEEGEITMPVGPGLAAALPPQKRSDIFNTWIAPRFADGDADGGMLAGVGQILAAIAQSPMVSPVQPQQVPAPPAPAPAEPLTEMSAAESADVSSDRAAAVPDSEPQAADQYPLPMAEESLPLPPWASDLPSIVAGFGTDPAAALQTLWSDARRQAAALPERVDQLLGDWMTAMRGADAGSNGNVSLVRSLLTAGLILLVLWKPAPALFWLGLLTAPLIAYFTGFNALSLCVLAAAIVLPLSLPLLRKLLAPSDDDEPRDLRKPFSQQAQQTVSRAAASAQAAARTAATRPSSAAAGAAIRAPSQSPAAAAKPAAGAAPVKLPDLIRGLRPWHIITVVIVTLVAPPLGVMLIVGWLIWRTSMSGAGGPGLQNLRKQIELQLKLMADERQKLRQQMQNRGKIPPRK